MDPGKVKLKYLVGLATVKDLVLVWPATDNTFLCKVYSLTTPLSSYPVTSGSYVPASLPLVWKSTKSNVSKIISGLVFEDICIPDKNAEAWFDTEDASGWVDP